MNLLQIPFKDYQDSYVPFLPIQAKLIFTSIQENVHHTVKLIDKIFLKPELILTVTQLAIAILSFLPSIRPVLEFPKQVCKDVKNCTTMIKGLRSVNEFLNINLGGTSLIFNISRMMMSIISTLILIDRTKLLNINMIKLHAASIPIFGLLPWGGLFSFSVIGLTGTAILFNLEKKNKLQNLEDRIKNEKLEFWSQPLKLDVIQQKLFKYKNKILKSQQNIAIYNNLIKEGKQLEKELDEKPNQSSQLYACQKALEEISRTLEEQQNQLDKCKQKLSQWELLEKNWAHIKPQELKDFQQAKQKKWDKKLNKIRQEKKANFMSIVNNAVILSRQALIILGVAYGYGIITLPFLVNAGLDAFIAGSSITNTCIAKSVKKTVISPVDPSEFIN